MTDTGTRPTCEPQAESPVRPESQAPHEQARTSRDGRPDRAGQVEWLLTSAANVVAPLTVISALLFYFGYASSRAQYEYFGLDVDTIGLSTQDYVMRSPQPLLTPLLVLALAGIAMATAHGAVRRRIDTAAGTADDAGHAHPVSTRPVRGRLASIRRAARAAVLTGQVALAAAVALLFGYSWLREWRLYPLVTPLLAAFGAALTLYGLRVIALISGPGQQHRRAVTVSTAIVLVASVIWATATVAQWSGRGSAHYTARHLDQLPSIILDTRERLFLPSPGIEETILPGSQGQTFHYRYRNLRLLIQGRNRLFLVPPTWSPSNFTLVVPTDDGSVRMQFQFQNEPP